jgi:hypothetical protein
MILTKIQEISESRSRLETATARRVDGFKFLEATATSWTLLKTMRLEFA